MRERQHEEIARTMFLASAMAASEGGEKELNEAAKRYVDAADPFIKADRKRKDQRMLKLLGSEVERGPIEVIPMVDTQDKITFRNEPRLKRRKPYASLRTRKKDA